MLPNRIIRGQTAVITVLDADMNHNVDQVDVISNTSEILWVSTDYPLPGDKEYLYATETGVNTGVFTGLVITGTGSLAVESCLWQDRALIGGHLRFLSTVSSSHLFPATRLRYSITVTVNIVMLLMTVLPLPVDFAPRANTTVFLTSCTIGNLSSVYQSVAAGTSFTITVVDADRNADPVRIDNEEFPVPV